MGGGVFVFITGFTREALVEMVGYVYTRLGWVVCFLGVPPCCA